MSEHHSKYSPSQLKRIIQCPASVTASEGLESPSSVYAERGTELHNMVAEVLEGNHAIEALTLEDRAIVTQCIDYLNTIIATLPDDNYELLIEQKVSLSHLGLPEVYGTADICLIHEGVGVMHVLDWKFGQGVWVSAENNPQLRAYAAACLKSDQITAVTTHIFQPLLDNVSTEEMSFTSLVKWVNQTLKPAVAAAKSPNPTFGPSDEACRWCDYKAVCRARRDWINSLNARASLLARMRKDQLTYEEINECIEAWSTVETALKDYKAYLSREVEKGRPVPGYKLVAGRKTRYWKNESTVIEWLDENTDLSTEDYTTSKFKSPAQVEKLVAKLKKDPEFVELYGSKLGKSTLVKATDPRPALKFASPFADLMDVAEPDELE